MVRLYCSVTECKNEAIPESGHCFCNEHFKPALPNSALQHAFSRETLRAILAGMALQGLLAADTQLTTENTIDFSIQQADALLQRLDETK